MKNMKDWSKFLINLDKISDKKLTCNDELFLHIKNKREKENYQKF